MMFPVSCKRLSIRRSMRFCASTLTAPHEEKFDFSHAYFSSGLGIAIRREPQQYLLDYIRTVLSYRFFRAVGGLIGLLLCVGVVVWLLERRHNPEHFRHPTVQGIADGVWWSAVTMVLSVTEIRRRYLGWTFSVPALDVLQRFLARHFCCSIDLGIHGRSAQAPY